MITNETEEIKHDGNVVTDKQLLENSALEFEEDTSEISLSVYTDVRLGKMANAVNQDDDLSYGQRTREPAPLSVLSRVESLSSPKRMSAFLSENLDSYLQSDENRKICLKPKESSFPGKHSCPDIIETVADDFPKDSDGFKAESTDYRMNPFNPDFDDVEGMLFVSFDTKEAMEAHIRIEKQNHWDDNNYHFLDMCKLHKAANLKKRLGISGKIPKFLREKEQNYRGIHMKWFKYLRLFNRELSKMTGKPMKFEKHLAKSLEKTNDITKIKGWKNKFVDCKSSGEVGVSNGLPLQQTGKLHWRTEQRLLRSLPPEDIKDMGLHLKKKRRKNMIFTHRKGSSAKFEGRVGRFGRVQKPRFGQDDEYYYGDEAKYYEDEGDVKKKAKVDNVHIKTEEGNGTTGVPMKKPSLKKKLMKKYNLCGHKRLKKMWKRRLREGKLAALKQEEESEGLREEFPILTESMALHAVSVLDCNMLDLRPQNFNEVCPRENGADICSDKMATGDGRDDSVDSNLNKDRVDFEEDVGQSLCGKPGCRYGCVCHLFRDRTVPGSRGSDSDEVNKEETSTVCDKEYCRLGCICSSLERQLTDRDTHCRKAECMFNCHCEDKELTLHSLLSPSGSDDIPLLQAVTESLKSHETLKNLEPPEAAPARLTCPDLAEAEKKTTAVPKNRFAGLPKRVGSQRVAKNLDAITRKAMMYMDPDDLFPKPKRRHRKKDEITADEKTGRIKSLVVSQPTNEVVIYNQVDEAIEHGQMSSDDAIHTSPLGPLFGCSRTSIFNPVRKPRMHGCIKKNNTDKADVIDVVTDSPVHMEAEQPQEGSQFTDTVFIQKCFKNTAMTYDQFMNNVKPQEDLKLETVNNVISISDDDDDKVTLPVPPIPNITNPCPRPYTTQEDIQRRKKRKRKQRLEKTLLDGYGSPSKLSTEPSDCTSDTVTTVKVPVWDDWSTNMVCIKASKKRKSVPNSEERKTSSEHHLLEIKSNCSWEASRKMVLSGVAKCLRPYEYPDPQEIEIQNYTVEILPKASEPAKIPPSFSANFPSVMYTVRITVSPTWFHRKNKKVEEPKKDKGPEMTASKQLCLRLLQEQQQKAALQQQQQKQELQKPVNGPTVLQQQQPVLQQVDPVQKSIVVDTPPTERRLKAKTRSDKIKNTGKHFQPASGISGLGKLKINNSFIQLNPNISQQNSVFRLQEGQVTFKSGLPPSASLATATAKTTSGLVLNTSNAPGGFEDSINQTSSTVVTVSGTSALAMTHSKPSNHNATDAREITSLSSQNSNTTGSMPSPKPVGLRPDSLPTMQLIQNGAGMPKLVPLSAGKVGNMPLLQLVPMANTAGPRGTTPTAVRMQGQSGTTTSSVTSGNKNYVAFPVILQTVNPGSTSGGGTGAKANGGLTLRASGLPTGCVMAPTQSSVFPVKMGTEQRPVFLAPVTVQPANPGVIPTPISFTAHPAPTINSTNSDSQKHLDKDMDTVNSAGKTDKSENTVSGINLTGRRELYSVLTSSQAPSLIKSTSNQENKTRKEKSDLDNAAPDLCVHLRTGNSDIVCDISVIDSNASSTENNCSDGAQVKHLNSDQEIKKSPKLKTEADQSENDKPKVFRKEEVETSEVSLTSADSDGAKKSFVEVRSLLNMVASQSGVKETSTLSSDKPSEKPLTREIYGQDNFIDLTEENSDKTSCAIETSDMDVSVSKSLNDEKQCVELPAGIPNSGSSKYTLDLINIQKLIKKPLGFPSSNPHSIGLVDGLKQVSPTSESDNVAKSTNLSATENCADNCAEISSSAGVDSTVSASGINTRYTQDSGAPQGTGITEGGVSHADHTIPDKSQGVAKATTSSGALTSELDTYSLDSWSDVSNDGDSQQESRVSAGPTHSPPLHH
ncbi:uncharacterized protein LOC135472238 [Liolophura sinensis]|uniref:uncharacterized protein LOC135472238 n=1 Tax=Liolophura sinensis TaxID=3198878 RepID=UPI0031597279